MYNTLIAIEDGLALSRTPEQLREEITNDIEKNPTTYRVVILNDGEVFGYIRSYAFGMDTKHKRVIFEFDALGDRFDEELVELLREQALFVLRLRDAKKLVYKTRDTKIHDAMERMGGEINAEVTYFKLDINNANTALMEEAIERNASLPGFTLKFYDKLPEAIIPEFCERFTEFLQDMPGNPDVEVIDPVEFSRRQETRDPNQRFIRAVLFDADQKIAGATSIAIDMRNPDLGYQHMTGVVRKHRGRGFGLFIKSMAFFKLREDHPEMKYVYTDTLAGNIYMQHVNRQLGYEKRADAREYRLTREALEAVVTLS
jgi:RimJ/RimL family protein N-acetyltransferase